MEIPAFFVAYEDKKLSVNDGRFTRYSVEKGNRKYPVSKITESLDKNIRSPITIIDCNSFDERGFSERVMKHLRIQGADIWFMTFIETVEDVFDAFNKDATLILAPYHFIQSDSELRDICDVSDSVVPVIFVQDGKAVDRKGRKTDILSVLERLVSFGYYKNYILDMEGSLDEYTWSVIQEDYPSTIPFIPYSGKVKGFEHCIVPYLL